MDTAVIIFSRLAFDRPPRSFLASVETITKLVPEDDSFFVSVTGKGLQDANRIVMTPMKQGQFCEVGDILEETLQNGRV